MRKRFILGAIFGLVITLIFVQNFISAKAIEEYSYTKAICNSENYCEDYIIHCQEGEVIKFSPTGFTIQQSKNWEDDREDKTLCD